MPSRPTLASLFSALGLRWGKPVCGIYSLRHRASGKTYIGKSTDIRKRLEYHRYGKRNASPLLGNAIKAHGWDSFEINVFETPDEASAFRAEVFMIAMMGGPRGGRLYNMTDGGDGPVPSRETRAKIRRAMLGTKRPGVGAKIAAANRGRKQSEEARFKAAETHRIYSREELVLWAELRQAGWSWPQIHRARSTKSAEQVKATFYQAVKGPTALVVPREFCGWMREAMAEMAEVNRAGRNRRAYAAG